MSEMPNMDTSDAILNRPNFLCPEILHPGQTGCKYVDVVERLERVEIEAKGHTITLTRVEAYSEATVKFAKICAWLIGTLLALASLYFASMTIARH